MIKTSFLSLFLFLSLALTAQNNPMVHRHKRVIVDSTGREIKLRGVNLGGWLLWEEWIWGGGFHSESRMMENLEKLVGAEETQNFRKEIYHNFITEEDISQIAAQGLNVVRIPFNHRLFDLPYDSYSGMGWDILDQVLGWCKKHGVYAVLDLHSAPGGQSSFFIADPEKENLWKKQAHQDQTVALWKAIAKRYHDHTEIAAYDLLNEPIPPNDEKLLRLYERICQAIREVDTKHMLFMEGSWFARKFDLFKKLPDENMAFSFHLYTWLGGDPVDISDQLSELPERFDVPLWCGEWGENMDEKLQLTFNVLDPSYSGWCMWTWKKTPGKYPGLVYIIAPESWTKVIAWMKKPKEKNKPSREEALAAMKAFIEASKMSNCQLNGWMLDMITAFKR